MIGVVDYGMGNLWSMQNALDHLGFRNSLIQQPDEIRDCGKLIIPGVGAFAEAIATLKRTGLGEALKQHAAAGKPLLGVCLGMQLLCLDSDEDGHHEGLGIIPAHVRRFPESAGMKVPHMGWNSLHFCHDDPIFADLASDCDVYFVHSHYVACDDASHVLAMSDYGLSFASIVGEGATYGVQFHPEKSQYVGLKLLENFVRLQAATCSRND